MEPQHIFILIIGGCIGALQALMLYILNGIKDKLNAVCNEKREDHQIIFERLDGHDREITKLDTYQKQVLKKLDMA